MRKLLRYRWAVLAVVGGALIAGAVVSELARRNSAPVTVETQGGEKVTLRGQLGPTPGPDAEGYIAGKRKFLDEVSTAQPARKAAGLVSLARFLAGGEVTALAGAARVDLIFVRFPGASESVLQVTAGAEAAMGERAGCACVYGVLLSRTSLAGLATLQRSSDVRFVDVSDPPRVDLRGWELRPILPK